MGSCPLLGAARLTYCLLARIYRLCGYFLTVVGAAIFAGPVVAPAFLGLIAVVLATASNLRHPVLQWRGLVLPLGLAANGLTLVNISVFEPAGLQASSSLLVGIPLAIVAVILWTWFGLANQTALVRAWTAPSGPR